jgi:hypothetical protein
MQRLNGSVRAQDALQKAKPHHSYGDREIDELRHELEQLAQYQARLTQTVSHLSASLQSAMSTVDALTHGQRVLSEQIKLYHVGGLAGQSDENKAGNVCDKRPILSRLFGVIARKHFKKEVVG